MVNRFVSSVRVNRYKCHRDVDIQLARGLNVVVGKNNAGKSALLEVLGFQPGSRSSSSFAEQCEFDFDYVLYGDDLVNEIGAISQFSTGKIILPQPHDDELTIYDSNVQNFLNALLSRREVQISARYHFPRNEWRLASPAVSSYRLAPSSGNMWIYLDLFINSDGTVRHAGSRQAQIGSKQTARFVDLQKRTYYFSPDRMFASTAPLADETMVMPDGRNLAAVLETLISEDKMREFLPLVQQVFPDIKNITTKATPERELDILLWPIIGRPDRRVSLRDSGRGIAPILTILCLLFNERRSCVITIDEPQAFLHPSALRAMLRVFQQHPEHQFILATHSPAVVEAAGVERCHLVTQQEGISSLKAVNMSKISEASEVLAEVGATLRDVFGAEAIVWVEGQTEARCFELMMRDDPTLDPRGSVILPIRATGDLEGKHRELVVEIYQRMCQSQALVPPVVAFQFDREFRTQDEIDKLDKLLEWKLFVTERSMFENYLLNSRAIAHLLSDLKQSPVSDSEVEAMLNAEHEGVSREQWIKQAHGGKMLAKIFWALTGVQYRKVSHGLKLTEWLLEHEPNDLDEVKTLLRNILKGKKGV